MGADMKFNDKHIYAIFTAHHLLKNYLIKTFKEEGIKITPAHSTILFLLEQSNPRTMTDLSQALNLDNSTVTGLIDRLERSGFVYRSDHPDDRRKWGVFITREGRDEIKRARLIINRINGKIEAGFSKDEMASLHRVLACFNEKFG
jgi:DNA-binding MarR family transcriptional regulator